MVLLQLSMTANLVYRQEKALTAFGLERYFFSLVMIDELTHDQVHQKNVGLVFHQPNLGL